MNNNIDALHSSIKYEITRQKFLPCCRLTFLVGFIQANASLSFSNSEQVLTIVAQYDVANFIDKTLQEINQNCTIIKNKQNVKILIREPIDFLHKLDIIKFIDGKYKQEIGVPSIVENSICCKKSYVKGLYIGTGSFSKKSKRIEIVLNFEQRAILILSMLDEFGVEAHVSKRREQYVIYISKNQSILDFFDLIGAKNAFKEFSDTLIDINQFADTVRFTNCTNANLNKIVETSLQQIEAINKLKRKNLLEKLDDKYLETAKLRVQNPELGLQDLADMQKISKSALKYRLDKIVNMSKGLV